MIPKSLRPFISQLMEATNEADLNWREAAEGAFFAIQKDANLHLRYHFDPDTLDTGYIFTISRGGKDAAFSVTADERDYDTMRTLFEAVSLNAAGGADIVAGLFD
jgi:hypothetical protein